MRCLPLIGELANWQTDAQLEPVALIIQEDDDADANLQTACKQTPHVVANTLLGRIEDINDAGQPDDTAPASSITERLLSETCVAS